jgi:hypothetical protein
MDPLKIFAEKDANRIRSTSARNYLCAFSVAVGQVFAKLGAADGEKFAASAPTPTPDAAELARAASEYQCGFAVAFRSSMKARGAADGELAAAAIDVATLHHG